MSNMKSLASLLRLFSPAFFVIWAFKQDSQEGLTGFLQQMHERFMSAREFRNANLSISLMKEKGILIPSFCARICVAPRAQLIQVKSAIAIFCGGSGALECNCFVMLGVQEIEKNEADLLARNPCRLKSKACTNSFTDYITSCKHHV